MATTQEFVTAFGLALNTLAPGWKVANEELFGPNNTSVRFAHRHPSSSGGHIDVEFVFANGESIWDCVAGFGQTLLDKARHAAHLWLNTTGVAALEFALSRRGQYADHYDGTDPAGFLGWHAIGGGIIGFGHGDSPDKLQAWWLEQARLPGLSRVIGGDVSESSGLHGIKILLGGNGVAEVRLDGELHQAATHWLASLDWPRLEPPGFIRSYIILVTSEQPA